EDAGATASKVLSAIDTIATTGQFDNSSPRAQAPLGRSSSFPLSVAARLGARPRRAVLEVGGGQSPQHAVGPRVPPRVARARQHGRSRRRRPASAFGRAALFG